MGLTALLATSARAAGESPKEEYAAAKAAADAGRYAEAARRFARADELEPNDVALELALKCSLYAGDDPVLGMRLTLRAEHRHLQSAPEGRAAFEKRVGQLHVRCGHRCRMSVGTDSGSDDDTLAVPPGQVRVSFDNGSAPSIVNVAAGETRYVNEPPAPVPFRGAKAVFWVSVSLTAAMALATGYLARETMEKHDEFLRAPSADLSAMGMQAQHRTNVAAAATGVLGIATAGFGWVVYTWGRGR